MDTSTPSGRLGRNRARRIISATLLAGGLLTTAVGCGDGNEEPGDETESVSFAESTRARGVGGLRGAFSFDALADRRPAARPVIVLGRFVDVRPDRGWVNLEESEMQDGIDTREVPFSSNEAQFRSIWAVLDVEDVLYPGGAIATEAWQQEVDSLGTVEISFFLHNDTTFAAAKSELPELGRVIVPVVETDRGALGTVLEPMSGDDLVVGVADDGSLSMPLADEVIRRAVLGEVQSYDALIQTIASAG